MKIYLDGQHEEGTRYFPCSCTARLPKPGPSGPLLLTADCGLLRAKICTPFRKGLDAEGEPHEPCAPKECEGLCNRPVFTVWPMQKAFRSRKILHIDGTSHFDNNTIGGELLPSQKMLTKTEVIIMFVWNSEQPPG